MTRNDKHLWAVAIPAFLGLGALIVALVVTVDYQNRKRDALVTLRRHTLVVLLDIERLRNRAELPVQPLYSIDENPTRLPRRLIENQLTVRQLIDKIRLETDANPEQQDNIAAISRQYNERVESGSRTGSTSALRNWAEIASSDARLDRVASEAHRLLLLDDAAVARQGERVRAGSRLLTVLAVAMLLASALGALFAWRRNRAITKALRDHGPLQEALATTGAMLRGVAEASSGLIYAKDLCGRLTFANPAVILLVGKPWSEIEGRTDLELLGSADEGRTVMTNDRRIMDAGVAETLEEIITHTDGTQSTLLSTKAPLRDQDGRVVGMVGISVDITERKRNEAKLKILQHDLNQVAGLNAMSELSIALAHELNQPLAAIMNHLAMAEHVVLIGALADRSDLAKRIDGAMNETMRAGAIIKHLRAFTAISDISQRQPERISHIVDEVVAVMSDYVRSRGLEFNVYIQAGDARISVDRIELQQALLLLIRRGVQSVEHAGIRRGVVDFDVRLVEPDRVEISIGDNGQRRDSPASDRTFERFAAGRLDRKDADLSLARTLVERQGGELAYADAADRTVVIVRIPLPTGRIGD